MLADQNFVAEEDRHPYTHFFEVLYRLILILNVFNIFGGFPDKSIFEVRYV